MNLGHVRWRAPLLVLLVGLFATGVALAQEYNAINNPSLETRMPFFWVEGESGGTLTWTQDDVHAGEYALMIEKASTGSAASWVTGNQANTYWNGVDAVAYTLTAYVKVSGATGSATTAGSRIGVEYTFVDGSGTAVIPAVFLAADPSGSDWQELTTDILLPSVPEGVYLEAIIEDGATGIAIFDDFGMSSESWTMGIFGADAETPSGWMNWADGTGGYANVDTCSTAPDGDYVVRLQEDDTNGDEMVFYSVPVAANPSTDYIVSFSAKTTGMNAGDAYYPTQALGEYATARAAVNFFFHAGDYENDWSLTGGDQFIYLDQRTTDTDWTDYAVLVTSPEDASGFSMRARFNNTVVGTALYDCFSVMEVTAGSNIVDNGDFETVAPFYWSEGETGGTLTWATDDFHGGEHSLKIEKASTGSASSWITGNQANTYWNGVDAVAYTLTAYVKVSGATGSETTAGERIGVEFTFLDGSGADVIPAVFLAADPAGADWQELTTDILLPSVPEEVVLEAMIESGATGTAWFDDFGMSSESWTMGIFGADVETVAGFMNWTDGTNGYAMVEDVGDAAYSGTHALVVREEDTDGDEMVYYSVPYALEADNWYEFSVMVKMDTLSPVADTLYAAMTTGDYMADRAAVNFFFHAGDIENDWSLTGGDQFIYFDATKDSTGWVQYRGIALAPSDANGASMRARFNNDVVGEVWYDDFQIRKLTLNEVSAPELPNIGGGEALPQRAYLNQNYPNPFNASTLIGFTVPETGHVKLEVFDVLGRKIATLVDENLTAGQHMVNFSIDSRDLDLSTGMYFYRLSTPKGVEMKKMLFLK